STGASTDGNGNYEVTVASLQDTLVFTYIGYQRQEIPINGRTEIDVAMQPQAIAGDEVLVVGYSTKSRNDLSSSIQTVTADQIADVNTSNIGSRMRGQASGVYVTAPSGRPG